MGHAYNGGIALDKSQAMDQFLAQVERRAYRMAYIAVGRREDALDMVQDAMTRLVQRYRDRQASEWGPLFHRILQSIIRDGYRRSKVRNRVMQWFGGSDEAEQDDPITSVSDPATRTPEQTLQTERAVNELDRALRELPLRQQQAFLLRQWEGLDVAATAQAMQISEGSVKTHYSRAVQGLREKLEGHWP